MGPFKTFKSRIEVAKGPYQKGPEEVSQNAGRMSLETGRRQAPASLQVLVAALWETRSNFTSACVFSRAYAGL